ncbi:MAG: hypothetical protein U1F43_34415 [Myxococcota bacterium]
MEPHPTEPPLLEPLPAVSPTLGAMALSYRARLSPLDHLDEDGQQIVSAAEILVHDRERVHVGMGDAEDGLEAMLGNDAILEQLGRVFEMAVDPTTAHAIVTGTPLVEVAIYERGVVVRVVSK